jgi:uncharacterized integral membrane protein
MEEETKNEANESPKEDSREVRAKNKKHNKEKGAVWVLKIFLITIFLALIFSIITEVAKDKFSLFWAFALLVILLLISFAGDIIAISVTAADVPPLTAMAARKVKGAKKALKLVQSAEKVSSICSDVIGDVCGIISGVLATIIVAKSILSFESLSKSALIISIIFSSFIAAFTVSVKAVIKIYGIKNANKVILFIGKLLSGFKG